MTQDEDVALRDAYKRYAEACCSHDPDLAKAACADIACLVPKQREAPVLSEAT